MTKNILGNLIYNKVEILISESGLSYSMQKGRTVSYVFGKKVDLK